MVLQKQAFSIDRIIVLIFEMKRKRQLIGTAIIDFLSVPFISVIGLVAIPLYFNFINNSEYGFWLTLFEIISLFSLMNSGLQFYVVQSYSEDKLKLFTSEIVSLILFQLLIIIILLILAILTFHFLPFIKILHNNEGMIRVYKLMIINMIILSLINFFSSFIYAENRTIILNIINLFQKILFHIFPLIFLYYGFKINSFPLSFLITNLIVLFYVLYLNRKNININSIIYKNIFKSFKKITLFCSNTFIGSTSYFVLNFTDTIVIANFISNKAVTIYILTMKISLILRFIIARILSATFPSFTKILSENNFTRIIDLSRKFFRFALRGGIFFSVLIIFLNKIFIYNWIGYENYGGDNLTIIAALICLRESIFPVFSNTIFATREIKIINLIFFFEAILNLILSIILINYLGILGVAIGTLISFSFFSFIYSIYKSSKIININKSLYIKDMVIVLIKSLPSCAVIILGSKLLEENFHWIYFFLLVFTSILVNIIFFEARFIKNLKNKKWSEKINLIIEYS